MYSHSWVSGRLAFEYQPHNTCVSKCPAIHHIQILTPTLFFTSCRKLTYFIKQNNRESFSFSSQMTRDPLLCIVSKECCNTKQYHPKNHRCTCSDLALSSLMKSWIFRKIYELFWNEFVFTWNFAHMLSYPANTALYCLWILYAFAEPFQ